MYFYLHKINKNEQNILLEMCHDTCLGYGDGACARGINGSLNDFTKVAESTSATFLFNHVVRSS